jgi:hypothetical protein
MEELKTGKEKNENILIEVVKDKFSKLEMSNLTRCIKEIQKDNPERYIVWKDDKTTINEKIVISTHNGTFSVEELKKLIQCIRNIEQNKPTRHLNIFMGIPDKTIAEMQEINDSIIPGFPIKSVFATPRSY